MAASLPHFLRTVAEIESNSWWLDAVGPQLKPCNFTYSVSSEGTAKITQVPKEPFESLLVHVRRLTMENSPERLQILRTLLKQNAIGDFDRHLLDIWHKYWRLAFIKEPFELVMSENTEVMTGYRVYDCFINGYYFHSDSDHEIILHGKQWSERMSMPNLFFQNMFHGVVASLCLAAIALDRFIKNDFTFANLALSPGIGTVFDFVWYRNRSDQLDELYKVFNLWIEGHGGCKKCRWA